MKLSRNKTVFVFDLDDTLYQEKQYQLSGYEYIAKRVAMLYNVDVQRDIIRLAEGEADTLESLCHLLNLNSSVKESLLWEYRLHEPNLTLNSGVSELFEELLEKGKGIAIITDGRSISQRLKLQALGLNEIAAYISEDYGSAKPDDLRFKLVEKKFGNANFVYVGDNPKKDFLAPNRLGWLTFGIVAQKNNVHSQNCAYLPQEYHPNYWLNDIQELRDYLC